MAKIVDSNEFENEMKDGVVIVDFFADWCGPCKMLSPIFESLGEEYQGRVKFLKVDVDKSGDIADKFSVSNIPAMVILNNGEKQDMMVGFSPKDVIKAKIENYI